MVFRLATCTIHNMCYQTLRKQLATLLQTAKVLVFASCCLFASRVHAEQRVDQQDASAAKQAHEPSSTSPGHLVSGRVVNAHTLAPVSRALVTLNGRAVLTNGLGRFSFPEFHGDQASVFVTKPGYSQASNELDGPRRLSQDLRLPLELLLHPDAVITGTLKSRDGAPLPGVPVTLLKAVYDVDGLHASPAGFSMTDSLGLYRFVRPAGQYRVQTGFIEHAKETGKQMLPVSAPENSSSSAFDFVSVQDAGQIRLDLNAMAGSPVLLTLQMEPQDSLTAVQVFVTAPSGEMFPLEPKSTGSLGEYSISLLAGTYRLWVYASQGEQMLGGEAHATVTAQSGERLHIKLSTPSLIPIAISIDSAHRNGTSLISGGGQVPFGKILTPSSLNLLLQSLLPPQSPVVSTTLPLGQDHVWAFRLPGRYRLRTRDPGTWHVTAASLGTVNLLESDFVVSAGASGQPMVLAVSDQSGLASGTVDLGRDGQPAWVYLLPRAPSLTPYYELRTSPQGVWRRSVPPGSYTAVAVPHRAQVDLTEEAARTRFSADGKIVEIVDGGNATVDLRLSPSGGSEEPAGERP